MRAVVTGGAGFIGSTLVDRLLDDGHEVAVVDNLVTGTAANLEQALARHRGRVEVHVVDVRERSVVEVVASSAPEVVFHLAAQADVRVSVADAAMDSAVNVLGTVNVLEGARRGGARKVVLASSGGTIYGEPSADLLPLREDSPHRPVSPYGVAKEAAGLYLFAYRAMYGIEATALALGNVYGPRQDAHGEAGVVAIFAGLLLADEPCTIYGTGLQTRDFVYVDDVVDAFVRAADQGDGDLINVGTGREVSINELYRTMARARGVSAPPRYAPARGGELVRSCLDPAKARRALGWTASTTLAAGIEQVFATLTPQRALV